MAKPKADDCPLRLHRNRQWYKKHRGRFFYFGTDKDAALKKWAEDRDYILAGLDPPRADQNPTLGELANLYLESSRQRVVAGELRADHTKTVTRTLQRVIDTLGRSAKLNALTPVAWQRVRADLSVVDPDARFRPKTRSPTTVQLDLARIRAFLNWCREQKLIGDLDTGSALRPPPRRVIRAAKAARGPRLWKPEELLAVIDASGPLFRPVMLLAINGAMGQADIGNLRRSQVTKSTEYLDCHRNKTGVERRIWLWPETRDAIDVAVRRRPDPQRKRYADRLLLTATGLPWWRIEGDDTLGLVGAAYNRAARKAGVTGRTPYDLRRTFRTVASEVCDLEAINRCMGHEGAGEGTTYLQAISDDRIRRVCLHVRTWLFKGVA